MICQFQRTIKKPITIEGIGLHSGDNVKIKLFPANKNEGINFIKNNVVIPAKIDFAHSFDLCNKQHRQQLFKTAVNAFDRRRKQRF